jgi:hypothetical protein
MYFILLLISKYYVCARDVSNAPTNHMSKKQNSGASSPTLQSEKASKIFAHLAKVAQEKAKKMLSVTNLILVAILTAAYLIDKSHTTGNLAMLYSLANNGKLSGRADGNVYMRNGRIRGMRVPSLVQNAYTQTQRSNFGSLSSSWNALTQEQQLSWINARGFFMSDRFGNSVEVSGKELYVRLNQNLFNVGVAPITTAPLPTDVAGPTELTITADISSTTLDVAFTPNPTGHAVLLFATSPQSAGTFRPGASKYRLIASLGAGTASPYDAWAQYVAKFGTPSSGSKVFIKTVPINEVTGQAGAACIGSAIVTT